MNIDGWNDVFTLLSMMVLADERIYKEEVDTFIDSVMVIKTAVNDDTLITRDLAFEWFRGNREEVLRIAKAGELHIKAVKIILAMSKFEHREHVLRAMIAISMADEEFHPTEESLVVIAAAHWDLKLPSLIGVRPAKAS